MNVSTSTLSMPAPPTPPMAPSAATAPSAAWSAAPSYDRLTPTQWRILVGAILAAHVAGVYGLLQVREVREAVAEAMPIFVSIIAPPAPPKVEPPPPPPPPSAPKRIEPTPRVIAAAPSPAPAPFVVPAPPPEVPDPTPVAVAPAPAPVIAPPAPPAPPPPPRVIPASAVQYLEPLALEYPRLSKRLAETGRVVVRVFIDEAGLAHTTQLNKSSGFARLDEAALSAVQKARFKPYTENGRAVSGWAYIPIEFELEK